MRNPFAVTLVASIGVALGAGALASAPSSADSRGGHAFTVAEATAQHTFLVADPGSPPISLGDREVFSSVLSGDKRGTDGGVCTVVNVIDGPALTGVYSCNVTARFADGQITGQALVLSTAGANPARFDIAVTGGTGAYEGASGHVAVETLGPGRANLTFVLDA